MFGRFSDSANLLRRRHVDAFQPQAIDPTRIIADHYDLAFGIKRKRCNSSWASANFDDTLKGAFLLAEPPNAARFKVAEDVITFECSGASSAVNVARS